MLAAKDALAAQDSALQSVSRQLDQAERRYEVGLIAVTDVQIARAARDSAAAAVIAAKRAVANAEEQLRATTGQKYNQLAEPGRQHAAADARPGQRGRLGLDGAEPEREPDREPPVGRYRARELPGRDRRAFAHDQRLGHALVEPEERIPRAPSSAARSATPTATRSGSSTPMTCCGRSASRCRSSAPARRSRAFASKSTCGTPASRVTTARCAQTEQLARDAYQGVISQIAQVGALKQAVESNRVSLQATEAGYEVGTKTAIDVLASREQLVQARTNYSQAKYGYLNNIIALRLAAGNLDRAHDQADQQLAGRAAAAGARIAGDAAPAPRRAGGLELRQPGHRPRRRRANRGGAGHRGRRAAGHSAGARSLTSASSFSSAPLVRGDRGLRGGSHARARAAVIQQPHQRGAPSSRASARPAIRRPRSSSARNLGRIALVRARQRGDAERGGLEQVVATDRHQASAHEGHVRRGIEILQLADRVEQQHRGVSATPPWQPSAASS